MTLSSIPQGGQAVVIGATGAIGQACLNHLEASQRFEAVHGFGRRTDPAVEVTDEASIEAAAQSIAANGPLRLLLVASGHLHDDSHKPEKSWRSLDASGLAHAFAVNATGPALVMKHFLGLFPRDGKAVCAVISAKVGSIGDNHIGGWYGYRASKAALNQFLKTASIELGRKRSDAICVALHPGTVASPLSAPFAKDGLTVRDPAQAAGDLLSVIDTLTPADTGGFRSYDGTILPW